MENKELFNQILNEFEKLKKEHNIDYGEINPEELTEYIGQAMGEYVNEVSKELYDESLLLDFKVQKITENAVIPKYVFARDSGFDLHSTEEVHIGPFGRALVPTGLRVKLPENCELQVRPKSGLAINKGLTVLNTPGTVDNGYTGEIKVIVFNTNNFEVTIDKGMKVAQGVICPVFYGEFIKITEVDDVENTDRGDNGFGSTGLN